MSVLESFLTANYFGVASLLDDAKREQIDGHVIADFYITVSTLQDTSQGIKLQFPLGGYWQQMRAATTAMDMRQLQNIVLTHGIPPKGTRNEGTRAEGTRKKKNPRYTSQIDN